MTRFQSILRNLIAYSITATCLGSTLTQNAFAEPPEDVAKRSEILGKPETVEVHPATINLSSKREFTQVVVTGKYAGGLIRDLTPFSFLSIEQPDIAKIDGASIVWLSKMAQQNLK